ncbi:MAG: hypothetical protein HUU50_10890 [Candidatus Brocadiae bacterium]|nr:hypothetical protein [Candidatus Brocadiia bacterium]
MKKAMIVLGLLCFIAGSVFAQGMAEKIAQNLADMLKMQDVLLQKAILAQKEALVKELLAKKIHVVVFFADRLSIEDASQRFGYTEDKSILVHQVVEAFKDSTKRQLHWLMESFNTRDAKDQIEVLAMHELAQAVSMHATFSAIRHIAEQPEVSKVCLYSQEITKPDAFFLTPEYYQIKEAIITPVDNGYDNEVNASSTEEIRLDITPEQIINILKKVFEFVKENKPVVNTSIDMASAVPQGIGNWQQMAGWREKHTGQYQVKYVNGFGMNVVEMVVRAHFYYNGNYNGIGKYITCATSTIDSLNVMWGYTFNATAKIPDSSVVNVGTKENPVAGMKMFIHWTVDTLIQHQEGTLTFSFDGHGDVSGY